MQTKRQKKEYFKKYYLERRKEILIKQKQYQREMKKIAIELGNCTMCFGEKGDKNKKTCKKCRELSKKYFKKSKRRTK